MKKLAYLFMIMLAAGIAACNGATNKTGGATRDSSASHGFSGPSNPAKTETSTGTAASTNGTSDTSKADTNKNNPTDTSRKNP